MKIARLLAPLMVAVALTAPATVPAANAAPTDSQIVYTPAQVFAPAKTAIHKSQGVVLTNATQQTRTFVLKIKSTGSQIASATLAPAQSQRFQNWENQAETTKDYTLSTSGNLAEATITVISE